jgi:hypothetical protein
MPKDYYNGFTNSRVGDKKEGPKLVHERPRTTHQTNLTRKQITAGDIGGVISNNLSPMSHNHKKGVVQFATD